MSLIKKNKEAPKESVSAPKESVAAEIENLKAEEAAAISPPDEPAGNAIAAIPEQTIVPTGGEAGGPCATGGQQVKVGDTKAYTCACGAVVRVRPKKLADGEFYALVPGHTVGEKPTKSQAKRVAVQKAEAQPAPAEDDAADLFFPTATYALYLDCTIDGKALQRLETYAENLARELAESQGAVDIRSAPEKSALAFGKWKGIFSAHVKDNPPAPGYYAVSSTSELGMEAFHALISTAGMVVRGGR